jgi:hypothetical protein
VKLVVALASLVEHFNPYHDSKTGRFSSKPGTSSTSKPKTRKAYVEGSDFDDSADPMEFNDQRPQGCGDAWFKARKLGDQMLGAIARHRGSTPRQVGLEIQDRLRVHLDVASVFVAVHSADLSKILRDGKLKNQFESGTSSGLLDPSTRELAERWMMGIGKRTPGRSRPIYGYLSNDPSGGLNNEVYISQYGNVRIKVKDSVKSRTTFTDGDSLDDSGFIYARLLGGPKPHLVETCPSPVNRPSVYSLKRETMSALYDGLIGDGAKGYGKYLEAHVRGGVGLNDIEYVVIGNVPASKKAALKRELDHYGVKYVE